MVKKLKPSKESLKTRYYIRATKRMIWLAIWLFILFLVIMGVIWAVPKVWKFAFG